MSELMTRADRETLVKIARQRERVAKTEAKERSAQILAEFEQALDRRYAYDQNEVWEAAVRKTADVLAEAQKEIAAECERLGIPAQFAPSLQMGWRDRGRNASKDERAEMRRVAMRQVELMEKSARTAIERRSLETQEKIIVGGLTTEDARQFLDQMPTVDNLMPALSIESVQLLITGRK